jgi:penicillin-binding protein 1A
VAKKLLSKLLKWLAFSLCLFAVIGMIGSYFVYKKILEELPDVNQLKEVHYQIPLQIFSNDGALIAEFGEKKRTPVTIDKVPKNLIHAFISAEDDSFETHPGVDYKGIIRAAIQLALTGKKSQGGSTITMQVTRNFLLTSEKTFTRKIKEIILALQIEQTFSKDKILELYLNKIYLGHRSYGVVAAAHTYFGKSLDELTIAESAIIAGLPKAPSLFNPFTNEARALERRNYVLRRMHELNHINAEEFEAALKQPNTARPQKSNITLSAPFVAEMVRKKIVEQYGEEAYNSGMRVYTTITQPLQTTANRALRNTLHAYDERHGYRYASHTALNKKKHLFTELPIVGNCLPAIVTQLGLTPLLPNYKTAQQSSSLGKT